MQVPIFTAFRFGFSTFVAASLTFVIIHLSLLSLHVVYATDVDSIIREDHNHPLRLHLGIEVDRDSDLGWEANEGNSDYEPEFAGMDRGIIGRASPEISVLGNNAPQRSNIEAGEKQYWVFPNETLWGPHSAVTSGVLLPEGWKRSWTEENDQRIHKEVEGRRPDYAGDLQVDLERRQDVRNGARILYITFNTCLQPSGNFTDTIGPPPQLLLYVSLSERNQRPGGPSVKDPNQQLVPVQGGFANLTLNAPGTVYIGVAAPNNTDFLGLWNYELAASIDAPYHSYGSEDPNLLFVDSDTDSALLVTSNMTQADPDDPLYQKWMKISPPFSMFAHKENDLAIKGVENSYCGLKHNAQIVAHNNGKIDVGMTNRGLGSKPKEQFHIQSLNGSSTYYGFLAMEGKGVVGGGGKVWKAMNFSTKSDGNCQLLFDLSYCSEVAYAVPSNPKTFPNVADLKTFYDDNAKSLSQNFSYSLQQIPCNTSSSAQYSLARNCDDCAAAYKTWLCAVTIPRCYDFSSNLTYLQPRNVAQDFINGTSPSAASDLSFSPANKSTVYINSSRNSLIDEKIKPGPYKEVLPCQDLCHTLVQSCPAAFGFACPLPKRGLEWSYGIRDPNGAITCSFPGAAYFLSDAGSPGISAALSILAVVVAVWKL